jgi:hypothetical protein
MIKWVQWVLLGLYMLSILLLAREIKGLPTWLYWPCLVFFVVGLGFIFYKAWEANRPAPPVRPDRDLDAG